LGLYGSKRLDLMPLSVVPAKLRAHHARVILDGVIPIEKLPAFLAAIQDFVQVPQ
jgi:hypothetical protein